ncbi:MAG: hypothetical protein Q8N34_08135, partial [Gammaproteobacteria bacterium]|nr:hypothetical protein [Gammaproteobacteria bacterium]
LERSGGHGGQMLAIDAGEDPWMSAVLIMAGIINGENNRSMLGEHLLEQFSDWFSHVLVSAVADNEKGRFYQEQKASCVENRCLVTVHEEVFRQTDHHRIDWREIVWDVDLPIDVALERLLKVPLPATSVRIGTQNGYPLYGFEKGIEIYQSEIVDGVVVGKRYIDTIWTGNIEERVSEFDWMPRTRTVVESCLLGVCGGW